MRIRNKKEVKFFLSSLVILAFLSVSLLIFSGSKNADWFSYQNIFNTGGAWLKDQSRDVAFLFIIDGFKERFGQDYESFRFAVGIYFLLFTCWALWYWRNSARFDSYFWSYAGVIPLMFARFTVQIREGIAVTFVFVAFSILFHLEKRYKSPVALIIPVSLLIIAGQFHSATLLFLPCLLFPYFAITMMKALKVTSEKMIKVMVMLTLAIMIGAFSTGYVGDWIANDAVDAIEGFRSGDIEFSIEKLFYWGIKACCVWYLIVQVRAITPAISHLRAFSACVRYVTFALIPVVQTIIIYLVWTGGATMLASNASRLYHLLFCTIFAVVSFLIPKGRTFKAIVLFFVFDGSRVLLTNAAIAN